VVNNQKNSGRVFGIVTFVTLVFCACVALLVSAKTGMPPWEMNWVDSNGVSSLVLAILHETRYELIALSIAAINAVLFGIYFLKMNAATSDEPAEEDLWVPAYCRPRRQMPRQEPHCPSNLRLPIQKSPAYDESWLARVSKSSLHKRRKVSFLPT